MDTRIKICGVTQADEVLSLDELGVSYAGLWYGMPQGEYNLDLDSLIDLTSIPTNRLEFILVTTMNDIGRLSTAVRESNLSAIQLHGFQLPAFIHKFKKACAKPVKIFKVLHVHANQCAEEIFIQRYLDAGTDYFILDSYSDKEKIGSTGIRIAAEFLDSFFAQWNQPEKFMLAGGIDQQNIAELCHRYQPYGIDIDTAVKRGRRIDHNQVSKIMMILKSA